METTPPGTFCRKVLIIDDTDMDLIVGEMVMKRYSFANEIVLKKSALSALEYLETFRDTPEELPQLIFLDINMPELSGFDFLDRYANLPEVIKKHCIIMMLSTSLVEEDHIKATENIFVKCFLSKPLDRSKIDMIKKDIVFTI